jgi:hypothetical protein
MAAAPAARHQQRPEHDEQDEAEVQQQDRIGEQAIRHACMLQRAAGVAICLGELSPWIPTGPAQA